MAYLITGAAGFIASHFCEMLVESGTAVVGVDNFDPHYDANLKRRNIEALLSHKRFTFVDGDMRDEDVLDAIFTEHQPTTVVHLAARAGVRGSVAAPSVYTQMNVLATVSVLSAAARHNVRRFVLGSSSSVYGTNSNLPFSEDQTISAPTSPYAASKVAAEAYCRAFHHIYGLPVMCLRFFTVYGPGSARTWRSAHSSVACCRACR